jgi:hypothetical protein
VSNIFGEVTLETRAVLKFALCLWYSVLLIISEGADHILKGPLDRVSYRLQAKPSTLNSTN